MHKMYTMA